MGILLFPNIHFTLPVCAVLSPHFGRNVDPLIASMHAATGAPIPTAEPTTYAPTTGAPSVEPTPEPTGVPTTATPTAAPTVTPVFSTATGPEPFSAFQFDPTKNNGATAYFHMSQIEFEGTDGAVIDLSDCTATGPATQGSNQGPPKAIDGSMDTKWQTSIAVLSVGDGLVIACSTPKTVVKFRWATANDVSRPAHAYQCC